MKIRSIIMAILPAISLMVSCKDDKPKIEAPVVELTTIDATLLRITVTGIVRTAGSSEITECGIYWGTDPDNLTSKVLSENTFQDLSGGTFVIYIDDFNEGTTYYFQAFARNRTDESKSDVQSETTAEIPKIPEITSPTSPTSVDDQTASFLFRVSVSETPVMEYGYYLQSHGIDAPKSVEPSETPQGDKGLEAGTIQIGVDYTISLTGLTYSTWYTITPYAINSGGESTMQTPILFHTKVKGRGSDTNIYEELPPIKDNSGTVIIRFLDKNLGAPEVSTAADDVPNAGWMYQWGRPTDGHQITTSATQAISTRYADYNAVPADYKNKFLVNEWNWTSSIELWDDAVGTKTGGVTNPCPEGYHVPSIAEWTLLRANTGTNDRTQYRTFTKNDCNVPVNFSYALTYQRFPKASGSYPVAGLNPAEFGGYYSSTASLSGTDACVAYFQIRNQDTEVTRILAVSKYKGAVGMFIRCARNPENN